MELGISGVIGLLFGSVLAWLALRSSTASLQARLSLMEKELAAGKADLARLLEDQKKLVESRARLESTLESERKANHEKMELLTKASEDLQNAFKALAADALKSNNLSFLQIAQETLKRFQSEAKGDLEARQKAVADLVTPVRESLSKVDSQIQQMEVARGEAYGDLKAQVQALIATQKEPGACAAHSERSRAVGRDPATACRGNCGDASLLRFRRARNDIRREWAAASGSDREVTRWQARRSGCEDTLAGVS
jgi:DNA recombination protein RmuC